MDPYFVNLSNYFNHIIYKNIFVENDPVLSNKAIYGLPHYINTYIIDEKNPDVNVFGESFCCASKNDIFDNVVCDGQTIMIDEHDFKSVMFLGFCEMGTVCDTVKLYDGNNNNQIPLILKTFHSDKFKGIDDEGKNSQCKLAFYLNGDDGQKHGVFFWKVEFDENINVNYIELPVNCALHLMAITLK